MAKRTISFSDYEEPTWEEYTGPEPPANQWFTAQCTRVKYLEEDDQLMFVFEITEGDYKGWGKGWYAPFEGDLKWKMHQVLKALQGGATKDVTVDWENEKAVAAWLKKQHSVRIKTREYNDRISINKVSPLLEVVPAAPKAVEPQVEDSDEENGGEEDYTEAELAELSVEDLEEILAEEFEVPEDEMPEKPARDRTGAKYKKVLIEAILEEQDGGDEDDEGDDEPGNPDGGDEEFDDGFEEDDDQPEPEPEPEPAPTRRRRGAAAAAAPAKKAAPAKAAPAARRRRG